MIEGRFGENGQVYFEIDLIGSVMYHLILGLNHLL